MRILVADDEQAIRTLVAEVLTEEGHVVTQGSSAQKVLTLASEEPWDLFLVDTLGGSDHTPSRETEQLLQTLSAHAPVILCTARSWAIDMEAAELGVAAILVKPFDITELIEQVATIGSR